MSVFTQTADFIRKDPFGVIWVTLIFMFVCIARYWLLDSSLFYAGNCIPCVLGVVVILSILVSLLITAVWIAWAARAPITMGFYFIVGGIGVLCAMLLNKISQAFVNTLYFKGFIGWQQDSISILMEDIVPHTTGLYLGSLALFLSIRMLLVKDIENRAALILTSCAVLGVSSAILLLGIKLY